MKCCNAWELTGSLSRPCIACIDLRSLSLNRPSRYRLAAATCGRRVKQPLKPSRNWPSRRNSARAPSVRTPPSVRDDRSQYKSVVTTPVCESDKVVLEKATRQEASRHPSDAFLPCCLS